MQGRAQIHATTVDFLVYARIAAGGHADTPRLMRGARGVGGGGRFVHVNSVHKHLQTNKYQHLVITNHNESPLNEKGMPSGK